MILVTIGMNDAPYGPMFQIVEKYVREHPEEAVFQIGNIDFESDICQTVKYLDDEEMQKLFDRADLIIAHSGVGTILNGLKRNIPLVLVPRNVVCECYKDQQEVVAKKVEKMGRGVRVTSLDELPQKIEEARKLTFDPYRKNTDLCDNLSIILANHEEKILKKKGPKARK